MSGPSGHLAGPPNAYDTAVQPITAPQLCAETIARDAVRGRYLAAGWAVWTPARGFMCTFIAMAGNRCHFIYVVHPTSPVQLNNNPQVTPNVIENNFIQNAAQNGAQPVLCAVTSRIKKTDGGASTEYTVTARIAGTNQAALIGTPR